MLNKIIEIEIMVTTTDVHVKRSLFQKYIISFKLVLNL